MNTLKLIVEREYANRVRKKSFILMTILMPFLFVALALLPLWLANLKDSGTKKIAVVDYTGIYASEFQSDKEYDFELIHQKDSSGLMQQLGDRFFAILTITDDLSKNPKAVSLTSEKQAPMDLQSYIEETLSAKVTEQRLEGLSASANVDQATIGEVKKIVESKDNISLSTLKWSKSGSISETSTAVASIVGMIFTILIYMFIMTYGSMVMQAVMEEKRSRIVEVMISSVKPVNLLIGKIIAIGLVGLTQLFIWGIMIGILMTFGSMAMGYSNGSMEIQAAQAAAMSGDFDPTTIMTMLASINWLEIFVNFIVYFIGGYVLYASIFAAIGSSVDNEQDHPTIHDAHHSPTLICFLCRVLQREQSRRPIGILVLIYPLHIAYCNDGSHSVRHTVMAKFTRHHHFVWIIHPHFDVGCKNLSRGYPDVRQKTNI